MRRAHDVVIERKHKDNQAMLRPRTLREVIRQYVNTRREPAISVSVAARAVRAILPECPLDGRALDNAIASGALAEGYAVVFDRSVEFEGDLAPTDIAA
jgi:hypothetical protein